MARLRRRWRVPKWAGVAASLLLAAAWCHSIFWIWEANRAFVDRSSPDHVFRRGEAFWLEGGIVGCWLKGNEISAGTQVSTWHKPFTKHNRKTSKIYWKPHWNFEQGAAREEPGWRIYPGQSPSPTLPLRMHYTYEVCIPLWIPFLLVVIPTAIFFRRDRRIPPHCCQGCGYDLTGNTSGRCPECGERG